jgi:putative hemolysin
LIFITDAYAKRLRGPSALQTNLSAVDIEVLAQLARASKVIALEQERIIVNAVKLRRTKVEDVMIPRENIMFFRLDLAAETNLKMGLHAMHTRYPVSATEEPDKITGYINYKDLTGIRFHGTEINLEAFIRPILSLDKGTNLNAALRQLSAKRYHIAIIRDAEGRVVGMLTLEDIIEELVGEIEDEFDLSAQTVIPIAENLWRVGAALSIAKVSSVIGADLEPDFENQTLGQWLRKRMGEHVYPGRSYQHGAIKFTVQQARKGRLYQAAIETKPTVVQASEIA